MDKATRQHISSGVSTTSPSLRVRYRSRRTRSAGSVHLPTFDGRVSDSMLSLLSQATTAWTSDLRCAVLARGGAARPLDPVYPRPSLYLVVCGTIARRI